MVTKTMKYEIKYDKELYNLLSDIQYEVFLLKNKATSMAYDWQQFSFSYNERFGEYPKEKDVTGVTLTADINRILKLDHAKSVYSSIREGAVKEAVDKFKLDKLKILKGEQSISTYKRDGSFPIRSKQIIDLEKINSKSYKCKLALLSKDGTKERELKNGQIQVELRTGNGANVILDRILDGSYKMRDSKITKIKTKFYLLITYNFEAQAVELDEDIIMGIDVGITKPATISVSNDKWYYQFVGDGEEIKSFRNQVESRKRRIQQSRKWAGEGSVGHGIKTRIKPLEKINSKISNFRNTKNHLWSHYIIKEAVRLGVGTIQMEDLSGISKDNTFLKDWTFYDLQTKIEYKAKEKGIQVIKVKPDYTSQRCNKCGCINSDNRKTQDQFECKTCGHKANADVNASRNIAMKDIEKIIDEQLKFQEKATKHNIKYLAE